MGTELYHEVTTVPQAVSSYHRSAGLVWLRAEGKLGEEEEEESVGFTGREILNQ